MIKCKEDLINTAVFCHKGELRELYLKKCEQFGVSWNHAGLDISKYSLLMVDENTELQGVICCNDDFYLDLKRLTLSDLKPRTRTEYEKVTESIFDLRDEFERGELYWWYESDCKDKSEFVEIRSEYDLSTYFAKGNIYRKVEKEIDERQEFIEKACKVVDWAIPKTMDRLYDAGCRFQD
ncbi:hypothetical protein VPHK63_0003 [Vibrio phage K63]